MDLRPEPSEARPQRGSRQMSTIGLKVQQMPADEASRAAIRADFSTDCMSHEQDSPKGMGNTVS